MPTPAQQPLLRGDCKRETTRTPDLANPQFTTVYRHPTGASGRGTNELPREADKLAWQDFCRNVGQGY